MVTDLLNQLITISENCNAKVKVIVCDMGNTKLLKELKVYKTHHYYFLNPCDPSRRIYIVTCIPHCFKNLRNNILDYKLVYKSPSGKEVTLDKSVFERLIHDDSELGDLRLCPKVGEVHVMVQGHDRQRVKLATQLLSDTVAKALTTLYKDEYSDQAQLISFFDKFFDVMDSRTTNHWKREKFGFGKLLCL